MEFLMQNGGTIIVGAIVLVIIFFAVRSILNDKKEGKLTCGGNCAGCQACHEPSSCGGGDKHVKE